ncbi:VanZ family protein [Exiguobacterium sp. SH3S2]|uniref:VanZ family protein n=1 Tax=unclassified Exiguobacterium TaxID=2644629 RepID=UPI00103EECA0|nr:MULTISPECIES: VanZ family protein [unclassified Exiguobacterium]TCI26455.1 VanZ family protein [Exiguobacterium sp. SH5S4]TCI43412.1 VanZ family protein [Exiguobacterium sp. SH3S3]TCI53617.1 VanZ family protein [Exiguobacterium sp. SH5S13]TCI59258.1 VanZ family protein [Exiguobacterium sp. SH3S2]TCI66416.1 VanZ family protein [Exiguobacterium sp. SH3S1]
MYILKNEFIWIALILIGLFVSSATPYSDQSIVSPLDRFDWTWAEPILSTVDFDYAGSPVSLEDKGSAGLIEFLIRKAAHFTVFFALGALFVKAVSRTRLNAWLVLLFAWALANTVAIFDEFHQSLTPERTPLIQDVVLDSFGACCGVLLFGGYYLFVRKRNKHQRRGYVSVR